MNARAGLNKQRSSFQQILPGMVLSRINPSSPPTNMPVVSSTWITWSSWIIPSRKTKLWIVVQRDTYSTSNTAAAKRLQAAWLFRQDLQIPKQSLRFGIGREVDLTASFKPIILFCIIIH